MTTTVDQAHTESEDYFAGHFPGEDVENYSGHNDEMDAYRHAYPWMRMVAGTASRR